MLCLFAEAIFYYTNIHDVYRLISRFLSLWVVPWKGSSSECRGDGWQTKGAAKEKVGLSSKLLGLGKSLW